MRLNVLNPEEQKVIEDRGTEAPFSGRYDKFFKEGIYFCRRCGAALYRSESKFDSGCGWPSFDDEIPGAINRSNDADGRRTEITCARCDAHLGHVFIGEKHTPKDTRHCVNSLSMKFVPKDKLDMKTEIAYFGGGCFWCTEQIFKNIKGVSMVIPGYAGGTKNNPTYEEVCSGATGHAEIVKIEFDPTVISYEALLEIFLATHDPTTLNQQGADAGTQYRSIILYDNQEKKEIADKVISRFENEKIYNQPIVTELKPVQSFYEAEDYHKNYYEKNPNAAYCQAVISPKLSKLKSKFKNWLKENN